MVDGHGKGLAHPHVGERFSGHIESDEIIAQKRRGVKIGTRFQVRDQGRRSEAFIENEIGHLGRIKIVGGNGIVDRQGVDRIQFHVGGIPIQRVLN